MITEWVRPNKLDDCQSKSCELQTPEITVPKLREMKQN